MARYWNAVLAGIVCCMAVTSARPLKAAKLAHHSAASVASGPHSAYDLIDGDLDFDTLSPKDCAAFLCVSETTLATEYIETGCRGTFTEYMVKQSSESHLTEGLFIAESSESSSGVSTGSLLSLAAACGVFAAGVGFVAGYKTSPTFAYMRIPSLV